MAGRLSALCILELLSFALAQGTWLSGSCQGTSTLTTGLVKEVGQCRVLPPEEEQRLQQDCFSVEGDLADDTICKLLFKLRSACAIEKFWLPLGKVVRCIKTLHPEEQERDMSLMFPVVDEIGDLPVTKDVSAALKAFVNQMLTYMFMPSSDLADRSWTKQAICQSRLALSYQYERSRTTGVLRALKGVCDVPVPPLRLYDSSLPREHGNVTGFSSFAAGAGLAAALAALAAAGVVLRWRRAVEGAVLLNTDAELCTE